MLELCSKRKEKLAKVEGGAGAKAELVEWAAKTKAELEKLAKAKRKADSKAKAEREAV